MVITSVENGVAEGDVYKIDLQNGKPAHYYIILNDPRPLDSRFLAVSFTDRHNFPSNTDVWPLNYPLCPTLLLAKPSVVALRYAELRDQHWLNTDASEFVGHSTPEALQRARCNLFWFSQFLRVDVLKFARFYESEWKPFCGAVPQGTPKTTNNTTI